MTKFYQHFNLDENFTQSMNKFWGKVLERDNMGCDIHSYAEANYDGRW